MSLLEGISTVSPTTAQPDQKLLAIVRQTSWGSNLDDALLHLLISHARLVEIPTDVSVCLEGDPGTFMAFIVEGRLRVMKRDYFQMEQMIAQLGPGDSFGEMSLIDDEPRSASIQAVEPSQLLVLSAETFRRLLQEHPHEAIALLSQVCRVLSRRVRYLNRRVLEKLS